MIKAVITDLDDTLYSWVGSVVPALYKLIDRLENKTGIDRKILIEQVRNENRRFGHTENVLNCCCNLPCIQEIYGTKNRERLEEIFKDEIVAFKSDVKERLELSNGTLEFIGWLKGRGLKLIGYSDSSDRDVEYKLKELGILEYFDTIYTHRNIGIGGGNFRDAKCKKPSMEVLEQIINENKLKKEEVVYIGDSIVKDMIMCKIAGIKCIHYIVSLKNFRELYNRLEAISSWTEEDFISDKTYRKLWKDMKFDCDYEVDSLGECISIVNRL